MEQHSAEYYRRIDAMRTAGHYEGWLVYFLGGVEDVAGEAVATAQALFALNSANRAKVLATLTTSVMAARVFELLPEHPIVTIAGAIELLATTRPTVTKAVAALVDAGVVVETTGRRRDRTFGYVACLDQLRAGNELAGGRSRP